MTETRRGYLSGIGAYAAWGFFPLYFRLLRPAGPLEILAHRVIWSVVFVSLVLAAARNWRFLARVLRSPRLFGGMTAAAVLIAINWGTYIYGVNSSRVVETALGYFITPLVVVLLGVTVQRERLRVWQWTAVGFGALAVAVLTVDYGHLPYIALVLAASFGSYSLIKKKSPGEDDSGSAPTGCGARSVALVHRPGAGRFGKDRSACQTVHRASIDC